MKYLDSILLLVMAEKPPLQKRPNTEMSFSPEGPMIMDKDVLRSVLSELLEEKFESYLRPIKDELTEVKAELETFQNNYTECTSVLKKKLNN